MPKRPPEKAKATPHVHAYGSWQPGGLVYGRIDSRHWFRECECGSRKVRYAPHD